uniref:RNA helicase n=1 Tax=Steinernema glaseri TaxID=37863 RepID=A0A1I8AS27_9BILA
MYSCATYCHLLSFFTLLLLGTICDALFLTHVPHLSRPILPSFVHASLLPPRLGAKESFAQSAWDPLYFSTVFSNIFSLRGFSPATFRFFVSPHLVVFSDGKTQIRRSGHRRTRRGARREGGGLLLRLRIGRAPEEASFSDFELDERLLKAIGELGWKRPTQVQEAMIPMALEGKNILARARTGSGKTAAFLLPTLQKVIQLSSNTSAKGPFAIFVTPTKELTTQVFAQLKALVAFFPFLQAVNLADMDVATITESVDMIVSTPNRLLQAADSSKNLLSNVAHVVLDEADLLFSLGYEDEMKNIKNRLPSRYQTILTSATLSEDMTDLKKIFCVGPVVSLKLKEGQLPDVDQLAQYHIYCNDDDQRFSILISMIKLKLIVGKTIIFVKDVERCYQLSLFLQAFKVNTCILNAELPANCRCRIVHEFNEGRYNFVIASDVGDMVEEEENGEPKSKKSKKKKAQMDKEAGVSRGIDFHHVSNVINFDFPTSLEAYIHRVGRTARGWNKGTALSFAAPEERELLDEVSEEINTQMGRKVIMPYEVRMADLDAFYLRSREVLGQITRIAIREARLAEIRAEALRSNRLRSYFAANPRERAALENDKRTHRLRTADSVAGVSEYMVPTTLRGIDYSQDTMLRSKAEVRKIRQQRKKKQTQKRSNVKKSKDPLKTFDF